MTKGCVSRPVFNRKAKAFGEKFASAFRPILLAIRSFRRSWLGSGLTGLVLAALIFWLAATSLPLSADGTITIGPQAAAVDDHFGQYLYVHQADIEPFLDKYSAEMGREGIPLLLEMVGWIIAISLLVGWVIDVLISRGFAYFFAPAFAEWKRSVVYATGRLFLSFVYTGLLLLAAYAALNFASAAVVVVIAVVISLVIAFAAQVVWILYLYRTNVAVAVLFYIGVIIVHGTLGGLIAKPLVTMQAASTASSFVDQVVTPKLQAEADANKQALAAAQSARDGIKEKVDDLQRRINAAQTDQYQVGKEIEEKKNSDIYVLSQIIQARARGELDSAHSQLTAFIDRFPSSPLLDLARAQLAQINDQMAATEAQKKQAEADAARAAAQARADLLTRAGKGDVTLSEMRQALIGKSRTDVSDLLGLPSETGSDSWGYRRQMILNPLTNERHGLTVYFNEGVVQGVDYDMNIGAP